MKELISIIIPVYNAVNYLDRCIKSVIDQTYKNIEVILIDDGSTDGSSAICDKYSATDKRIKVVHKKNDGVSSARNVGLSMFTGKYITFVDADDTIDCCLIKNMYDAILKTNVEIVMVRISQCRSNKKNKSRLVSMSSKECLMSLLYQKDIDNGVCGKLYKRTLFNRIRFNEDIKIGEDLDVNYRILLIAGKVAICPFTGYNYLIHKSSAMHSEFSVRLMDVVKVINSILNDTKTNNGKIIRAAEFKMFMASLSIIMRMPFNKKKYIYEYRQCISLIKRYRCSVFLDSNAGIRVRIYGAIALVSPILLISLMLFRSLLKKVRVF